MTIQEVDTKRAKGIVQLIGHIQQKIRDLSDPESNVIKNLREDEAKKLIHELKELEHINKRLKVKVEL